MASGAAVGRRAVQVDKTRAVSAMGSGGSQGKHVEKGWQEVTRNKPTAVGHFPFKGSVRPKQRDMSQGCGFLAYCRGHRQVASHSKLSHVVSAAQNGRR